MAVVYVLTRWLHVVVLMGMTGMLYYLVSMVSPEIRLLLIKKMYPASVRLWISVLLVLTGISVYLLQAGQVGDGWSDLLSADILLALLETSFGFWWVVHVVLTVFLCIALLYNRHYRCVLWLAVFSLSSYGLTGHTTVHEGLAAFWFSGVQIIHLLAAAFWFGSLLVVIQLLPYLHQMSTRNAAIHSLMRFSKAGHVAVAVLLLAGLMNIISVLGWPVPLMYSTYSVLLLIKLGCIALLILLAIINRYYWVPRFSTSSAQNAFYRMTVAEVFILLIVMALSGSLATSSPMPM